MTNKSRHDSSRSRSLSERDKDVNAGTLLAHLTFMKRSLAAASHIASGSEGVMRDSIGGGDGALGRHGATGGVRRFSLYV